MDSKVFWVEIGRTSTVPVTVVFEKGDDYIDMLSVLVQDKDVLQFLSEQDIAILMDRIQKD